MSEEPEVRPDQSGRQPSTLRAASDQLGYVVSLPERALRSGTGLVGGMLRESAALAVPRSFQSSRTYTVMVQQMLDFLVHDVGGVAQGEKPSTTADVDHYLARKAIGNFVDMASLATLHVSPLMLLAIVSDVAHGSQVYLHELADELKAQGLIDSRSKIDHVNDLLTAVSDASASTGKVFNTPPFSVESLRETIDETRAALGSAHAAQLLPQAEVRRMWEQMREISRREGVGLLAVSGAVTMQALGKFATLGRGALSSVKVAGALLDAHVLEHYASALTEIRQKGLYQSLAATSQPYAAAVWQNFQPKRSTITEDVLSGKLLGGTWRAVRKWLGRESPQPPSSLQSPNDARQSAEQS
jgi:hypothetical protein